MKSDKEVIEKVGEENQAQDSGDKKGTSNAKNYTSQCTGVGLHKMFVALPIEEKGTLRTTCFAPLLLIDPITTMSTLVVEIFDRHLGDMKFQFGRTIIQIKPITNEFLFVDPEYMTNLKMRRFPKKKNTYGLKEIDDVLNHRKLERHHVFGSLFARRCSSIKFVKNYTTLSPPEQGEKRWGERNHIEAPTVGVPAVDAPIIGSSSISTEIRVAVVRVCSQLEEHVRDSTLPLGDTPHLRQHQFSTPEKTRKCKREEERRWEKEEDGAENLVKRPPTKNQKIEEKKNGKGERQKITNAIKKNKKAKEVDMPLKKEDLTYEQFDHQVASGEGLEVVKDLVVDDDVEVGMEANLKPISSEYGGSLLEEKEFEEEQPQVAEEEDSEPTPVVYYTRKKDVQHDNETMVAAEVAKTDIVFFNHEEVVGEAYQTKESKEVEDVDEASQTKEGKEEVEQSKEEVLKARMIMIEICSKN
ncbi:hypothetical protein GIB67_042755 [Kingdonia uniflora]|uniref:Uncharacterized protein n=1 Tax=Kingdonia uniflora TaxID=39325 RepID=A0A7J7L0V4_9MAGN|nr:hypothetical protein GIB67_042755 [Kingdonia uniflora]